MKRVAFVNSLGEQVVSEQALDMVNAGMAEVRSLMRAEGDMTDEQVQGLNMEGNDFILSMMLNIAKQHPLDPVQGMTQIFIMGMLASVGGLKLGLVDKEVDPVETMFGPLIKFEDPPLGERFSKN